MIQSLLAQHFEFARWQLRFEVQSRVFSAVDVTFRLPGGLTPMDGADQPLFGETRRRDKIINIVVATVTAIFVFITVLMAVLSSVFQRSKCSRVYGRDDSFCVYFADILLSVVIILLLIPQILVAYWYRRGELEPKFRTMIYYNAVVTILLCIAANMYFLEVGISGPAKTQAPPSGL